MAKIPTYTDLGLSPQVYQFVTGFLESNNQTRAYMDIHPNSNYQTASVQAHRLLKKPKIQKAIASLMGDVIDTNWVVRRLVRNIETGQRQENVAGTTGALALMAKYTGGFADRVAVDVGSEELFSLLSDLRGHPTPARLEDGADGVFEGHHGVLGSGEEISET